MDYIVRDSSLLPNVESVRTMLHSDSSIRVGIVREERILESGIVYMVEVLVNGKQVPVSCTVMSKWGGAHNYEEQTLRPWLNGFPSGMLLPASAGQYKGRSGDVVLVAYLNGQSREGVILGGLSHPARKSKLKGKSIAYISEFNGLERSITDDGSYKVTFKGYAPTNDATLKIPPTGVEILPPLYNPLTGGSYYGFNNKGSFIASDGKQFLKINKNLISGSIILKSGSVQMELGGNAALGAFSVQAAKSVMDFKTSASIKATTGLALQSLQVSIKGTQVAIGNDQFELFDGLIKLIDALGSLVVTSPVGTCTPLMSAPTWTTQILPLKIKISMLKGSLKSADSFSLSGDPDIVIKGNE
jgi:hypothetical protein